ncbi:hypothetical protein PMY12_18645 [Clostridium tertium]|jgi:hypothetical protein|uniref:hypothetical protein n=1 Tax=Clostridium tertium TaxID=1559 RepID=UPI00232B772D|nr:hypothetical protein [Clostridium tertium]MDB1935252.1 hypothetical protein [Clostridium tertium]MDB1939028.1 hypothetical protein [Clostridium tertium]
MAKVGKINSASVIARNYIQENIDKKDVKEIINYLEETINLKLESIERIYRDIKSDRDREIREEIRAKTMEERSKVKYKGRKREFFYIDDSKLWRAING